MDNHFTRVGPHTVTPRCFSPKDTQSCFYTGAVVDDVLHMRSSQRGPCPVAPPVGRRWFSVTVRVRVRRYAAVYLNGVFVVRALPRHANVARAGVVSNGRFHNVVRFTALRINRTTSGGCDVRWVWRQVGVTSGGCDVRWVWRQVSVTSDVGVIS